MSRAIELVNRHLESWNTRDNDIISETIAFPFVQYDHDGSMTVCTGTSELFDFFRAECVYNQFGGRRGRTIRADGNCCNPRL